MSQKQDSRWPKLQQKIMASALQAVPRKKVSLKNEDGHVFYNVELKTAKESTEVRKKMPATARYWQPSKTKTKKYNLAYSLGLYEGENQ